MLKLRAMGRHYGMDWLRIAAFGLLILYHVGMAFVHWPWHVKTAQPMEWLAVPMLATNAWRLQLLFVVSGFASAAVMAKASGIGGFARERSARLMIPVIAAAAILIPPQPWVELVTQRGYPHGYWHFWLSDYFTFGEFMGLIVPTWQHLWFVVYLWVYTLLAALLAAVVPARAWAAIVRGVDRALAGPLILIVPLALMIAGYALAWPEPAITHALFDDVTAHRSYLPMFAFGLFLAHADRAWAAIRRWWPVAAAVGLFGYAVVAGVEIVWPGNNRPPVEWIAAFGVARQVQGWGTVIALIGIADRWWNRDHPRRAMLTEAVFPFYIIHQTIIVVAMFWLLPLAWPPLAEFAVLVPVTALGCWLFYAVGRRIGWLRPLIGLKRVTKPAPPATVPASV